MTSTNEGIDLYGTRAISDHGQPVHDRCGQPLRWSTSYDEPHWVHTSAAAVMACPPMRGTL